METKLHKDLILAMKEKNTLKKTTIQMILADIKNKSIELKRNLTETEEIEVAKKQLKQLQDSLKSSEQAKRDDLIAENNERIEYVLDYLPKMLTKDEILVILHEMPNAKTMNRGQLIKEFMAEHKSEVEGKTVSQVVIEFLA